MGEASWHCQEHVLCMEETPISGPGGSVLSGTLLGLTDFLWAIVWATSFFKGIRTMGPYLEGGLEWFQMGFTRIQDSELGAHTSGS